MNNNISDIEAVLKLTIKTCESFLKFENKKDVFFVDPIEKCEIGEHYGASHAAASFIILGILQPKSDFLKKGISLLSSLLDRWDKIKKQKNFHADFNNFALIIAYDYLTQIEREICLKIKDKLLNTSDSKHNTINWLPMRWYVNNRKFEWTNDKKYIKIANACKLKIEQATNEDGGIEDILPKGTSFNLQYNLSTVALLQFMRCRGLEIDLSNQMGFLLNIKAPDGDINYQGRGTNQIFAWGMWIYLLSSSKNDKHTKGAISFLENNIGDMLKNKNIMLNKFSGYDKHLWWDYHFSSVYIAHFLFWLVLSIAEKNKKSIPESYNKLNDTGVKIYKSSSYFISTFKGRKKYLAEIGPVISAIWLKKYGMINKGVFGPWLGMFGNNNLNDEVILKNYTGLIRKAHNINWDKYKLINKFFPKIKSEAFVRIKPLLTKFDVKEEKNSIIIIFDNINNEEVVFNIPVLDSVKKTPEISLMADGNQMKFYNNNKIKTQYGWCDIYQSKRSNAREWILRIT